MLHLENFFEKSFALLLTTPSSRKTAFFTLKIPVRYDILSFDQNRGQEIVHEKD